MCLNNKDGELSREKQPRSGRSGRGQACANYSTAQPSSWGESFPLDAAGKDKDGPDAFPFPRSGQPLTHRPEGIL